MTHPETRDARAATERAFKFLRDDFGYKRCLGRYQWRGFILGYCGPVVGVEVSWYPRDPFTVWIVKLIEGRFPARAGPTRPHTPHYFDLADVEALCGRGDALQTLEVYDPPDDATAETFARVLRDCGGGLLRGDFSLLPALEQRIGARVRRVRQQASKC